MAKTDATTLSSAAQKLLQEKRTPALVFLGALAAVIVLVIIGSSLKQSYKNSADYAVDDLMHAVATQNATVAQQRAQIGNLSRSLLNQVYAPQLEKRPLSPSGSTRQELTDRIADLVIPSLAKTLEKDLITAIADGSPAQTDNLILQRIWADFSGNDALDYTGVQSVTTGRNTATAKLGFNRTDLEHTFTLTLALVKTTEDGWQVVDVPDFGLALNTLLNLQRAKQAASEAERASAMNAALKLVALNVSLRADGENAPALVAQIAFENQSDKVISAFSGNLQLRQGDTIAKTYAYGEQQEILPGSVLEQAIPLTLDAEKDAYLIEKFGAFKAHFTPVALQFADGTSLSLARE